MRRVYLLQRIRESKDWPKGIRIYADKPCTGWRTIHVEKVNN